MSRWCRRPSTNTSSFTSQDGTSALRGCASLRLYGPDHGGRPRSHALFKGLGVEPLSSGFTAEWLAARLKGKATPIKSALVDQRLIAGIGNIYACEALFAACISPLKLAGTLPTKTGKPTPKIEALVVAVKSVLESAIKAGGSSLRDYRHADGRLGRFQHRFKVYGREGKPCARKSAAEPCGASSREDAPPSIVQPVNARGTWNA